jgi:hypothetical protein
VCEFERAFAARGDTPLQALLRDERRAAEVRDAQFSNGVLGDGDADEEGSNGDGDGHGDGGAGGGERKRARGLAQSGRGKDSGDEDDGGDKQTVSVAKAAARRGKAGRPVPKAMKQDAATLVKPQPTAHTRTVNTGREDLVRDFDAGEFFS